MFFQLGANLLQIFKALGHFFRQHADGVWRANTRYDIFALGIDQVFTIKQLLAVGGVAGEGDTRGAVVAGITEYHGLYIDGGAPFGGNVIFLTVEDGAIVSPRAEHGADGAPELLHDILRECAAGALADQCLVSGHQGLQVCCAQFAIGLNMQGVFEFLEEDMEGVFLFLGAGGNAHDYAAVHLDEAAIAIPCKLRVV